MFNLSKDIQSHKPLIALIFIYRTNLINPYHSWYLMIWCCL